MCKLAAYNNFEPSIPANVGMKINKAIQHLWYINSFGQTDGAGIMYMEKDGSYGYVKDALPSTIMLQLNSFAEIKNDLYEFPFVAAHTRYSTVGSNSWENTHPFEVGDYLGMQNGTIAFSESHKTLVPNKVSPYQVDSASVIWSLDQQGPAKTFEAYEGEGVFIFINLLETTFNIIKNKHRNLYRAKLQKYKAYLYSTDKAALQLACDRSSLDIEEILPVSNDLLITYDLTGNETLTPMKVKETTYVPKNTYNFPPNPKRLPAPSTYKEDPFEHDYLYGDMPYVRKPITTYVCDCDNCSSPLYEYSKIYGDTGDIVTANIITCEHCIDAVETLTGKSLTPITNTKGT